jgi:hypothetical protein
MAVGICVDTWAAVGKRPLGKNVQSIKDMFKILGTSSLVFSAIS